MKRAAGATGGTESHDETGEAGVASGDVGAVGSGGAAGGAAGEAAGEAALVAYRRLLRRFHRTLDLMSPRAYADLDRFLAEAERYARAVIELAPQAGVVVDLGSGAGLPGVVVAARLDGREVWWVERRRRRAAFLSRVAAEAGLGSVRVVADDVRRVEPPASGVAAVTAQAVGTLTGVARATRHLWGPRVVVVSRKGPDWEDEVAELAAWRRSAAVAREEAGRPTEEAGMPAAAEAAAVDGEEAATYVWSAEPRVVRAEPLGARGTLVAVELRGG